MDPSRPALSAHLTATLVSLQRLTALPVAFLEACRATSTAITSAMSHVRQIRMLTCRPHHAWIAMPLAQGASHPKSIASTVPQGTTGSSALTLAHRPALKVNMVTLRLIHALSAP